MKNLLILRHAKSSWDDSTLSDHQRPLNDRGLKSAPLMGKLIKDLGLVPDSILSSTALRALQTAQLIAEHCGHKKPIFQIERFYPGTPTDYLEILQTQNKIVHTIMVVGHNPGLEELLEFLTQEHHTLPTAALAHVGLPINSWNELTSKTQAQLINIYRPKEIFT